MVAHLAGSLLMTGAGVAVTRAVPPLMAGPLRANHVGSFLNGTDR